MPPTNSNLAEHLDDVSHDVITDYLSSERHTARGLWELVEGLIQDSPEAFMLVDDSVQDKRYSQFIELVKLAKVLTMRNSRWWRRSRLFLKEMNIPACGKFSRPACTKL